MVFSLQLHARETIKVIVPFSAGGQNDRIARIIERDLSNQNYNFVVEFKPGANGSIAARTVADTKSGTVLMVTANGFVTVPLLNPPAGYNPITDFVFVRYIGSDSLVLVVKNDGKIKSFGDFIKMSVDKPMPYGTVGVGSVGHMAGSVISKNNKNFIHVPYKGASAVLPDLLNGNIKWTIDAVQNVNGFIANGELLPIAAYTPARIAEYPGVPTVQELGIDDHNLSRWYAVVANRNADGKVIQYLKTQLAEKSIQNRFTSLGLNTKGHREDFISFEMDKMTRTLPRLSLE